MSRRLLSVAAGLSVLVLGLSACGSGSGGEEKGKDAPYRVLVTGGLSAPGVLADNASTSVLSARASAKNINAAGGILGHKVEVTVVDDAADPTTAVTKLREAINSDKKPDLVLNSGPSVVAEATLPILKQNNILSFNIGPTETSSDPDKFPLNFDLSPGAGDYAKGFVPYLKDKGYASVGLLHSSNPYGESFGHEVEEVLDDSGLDVVKTETYDDKSLDVTPQLAALRAKNPDALILDAYGAPVGYVLKSLEKLGWDIPVVANNSVAATGLVSSPAPSGVLGTDQVKNLVMQVFTSTKYSASDTLVNDAVAAMKSIGKIRSTLILAYNYDSLPLVAAAAEDVGSLDDPEELAKALEDPEVQKSAKTAILKGYGFTKSSHSPNSSTDSFLFIPPSELKNGQFQ